MYHGARPGWIEVISGVMFAGKSEELIRRVRRAVIARRRVQVFKSHFDDRYGGLQSVSTHDGLEIEATPVNNAAEIFRLVRPDTEIVAIDEAQFLDGEIGMVAIGAGLARSPRDPGRHRHRFPRRALRADGTADGHRRKRHKLQAICVVCGDLATRNQRLVDGKPARYDSPTILVGGRETYEARCRHCHRVPRKDEDQTALL